MARRDYKILTPTESADARQDSSWSVKKDTFISFQVVNYNLDSFGIAGGIVQFFQKFLAYHFSLEGQYKVDTRLPEKKRAITPKVYQ